MLIKYEVSIKDYAKLKGVTQWEIADKLGVHENTINRKFRKELSTEEEKELKTVIDEIAQGKK